VRYDEIYQRRRVTAGSSDTEKQSPTLDKIQRRATRSRIERAPFKRAGPRRVIGGGLAAFLDRADIERSTDMIVARCNGSITKVNVRNYKVTVVPWSPTDTE